MKENKIHYLVGNAEDFCIKPLKPFSDIACEFLDELSKALRKDSEASRYPDIMTFAFWIRKANLHKLKSTHMQEKNRIGRGLVFHIAPSNVPINFAYSFVYGILSGNGNVVRASSKDFPQTRIVCRLMKDVFLSEKYSVISRQNMIIMYEHDKEINDYFSEKCDARVIWGGDKTINLFRESKTKSRCVDVVFADRYSFAIFSEEYMEKISENDLKSIAEKFYNDTYLMDQNACSSPHFILWEDCSESEIGRKRFYDTLAEVSCKFDLEPSKAIDKYTILCEQIAMGYNLKEVINYENLLYVAKVKELPQNMDQYRGKYGLFYDMNMPDIDELSKIITSKYQTCVTCGIDKHELIDKFIDNGVMGIDRIVDIGKAMDIGLIWDGYDVIGMLSRRINVE